MTSNANFMFISLLLNISWLISDIIDSFIVPRLSSSDNRATITLLTDNDKYYYLKRTEMLLKLV